MWDTTGSSSLKEQFCTTKNLRSTFSNISFSTCLIVAREFRPHLMDGAEIIFKSKYDLYLKVRCMGGLFNVLFVLISVNDKKIYKFKKKKCK
jgi:hypothetical protein